MDGLLSIINNNANKKISTSNNISMDVYTEQHNIKCQQNDGIKMVTTSGTLFKTFGKICTEILNYYKAE